MSVVLTLLLSGPYLEFFEQRGSADIVYLISGWGGGGRDDTYKSVIVTLSDLW